MSRRKCGFPNSQPTHNHNSQPTHNHRKNLFRQNPVRLGRERAAVHRVKRLHGKGCPIQGALHEGLLRVVCPKRRNRWCGAGRAGGLRRGVPSDRSLMTSPLDLARGTRDPWGLSSSSLTRGLPLQGECPQGASPACSAERSRSWRSRIKQRGPCGPAVRCLRNGETIAQSFF